MTIDAFWDLIESSWTEHPALLKKRNKAVADANKKALAALADDIEDTILDSYQDSLYELEREELTAFIHHLEERLHNIDRRAIQEAAEGSEEGFVYTRCYIVAMGRAYYEAVDHDPLNAAPDAEAEGFGFTAYSVYADRFDEEFKRHSKHNITTGANKEGWP